MSGRAARARRAAVLAAVLLYVGLGVVALSAGLWAEAAPADRAVLERLLTEQAGYLVVAGLLLLTGLGLAIAHLLRRYAAPARRMAAETQIMATVHPSRRLDVRRPAELAEVAAGVNALAERVEAAERDVERQIATAAADVEQERNRLAALMSELALAVLVCNADGQILLYNTAARRLSDLVGLGRSVFGIVERSIVGHALDQLRAGATPSYEAVATHGERLLRVQVAAVGGAGADAHPVGFVLLLEDVTRPARAGRVGVELLRSLTESTRASAGNIRAAVENVLDYPDMAPAQRRRFAEIIREESVALGRRVDDVLRASADSFADPWALADMHGPDLLAALARSLHREHAMSVITDEPDDALWLRVDSYAIVQAVGAFAGRLRSERGVREVRLGLVESGPHAALDLRWAGLPVEVETVRGSLRQVAERHGGEVWCQADRAGAAGVAGGTAHLRLLLPRAEAAPPAPPPRVASARADVASRPEFYDFDLFERIGADTGWDERPLDELTCTVFDTETTGLYPDQGDEIIAIGAVRILNGRLLHHETFDQLVNPNRPVSLASQQIHGIRPELLRGQPTLAEVLPAFARFAEDTVLVGHNVAFDLRFLRLKEQQTGVRLVQPVLDTLLLSAVAHPAHETHSLEAIAERLGVSVLGRHTALGDAVLTGEIFLRLARILAEQGTRTLGAAREAARRTYQARVSDSLYG
jgi:DNA polymerase-3 subunit epsilon